MRITIHYLAQLKRLTRVGREELDVDTGLTPAGLLARLVQGRDDAFRNIVLAGDGRPHPSLLFFVGDEQIQGDANQPLQDGDVVTLLTPMAGG